MRIDERGLREGSEDLKVVFVGMFVVEQQAFVEAALVKEVQSLVHLDLSPREISVWRWHPDRGFEVN